MMIIAVISKKVNPKGSNIKLLNVSDTAWPWFTLNKDVNGYDTACGAIVFEIDIAFPE